MFNIEAIIELIDCKIVTTGDTEPIMTILGFSPLNEAKQGELSFYGNAKYYNDFTSTKASAVLVQDTNDIPEEYHGTLCVVENVYTAVAALLAALDQGIEKRSGRAATSIVADDAVVGETSYIGEHSSIASGSQVGAGTQIMDQVYIGKNVKIGKDCLIYPGVRILHHCVIGDHCVIQSNTVVGSEGFGYTPSPDGSLKKIPQIGKVIIEDHVEIGSNCAIDRGSLKDTIIRSGVKLDNLIQVAHNVEIGSNTVIAAQTGIAGSTKIGSGCMIGGQVGIVGHLDIADNTKIQAQSGMIKSVKDTGTAWYGYPAIPYRNYMRSFAAFKNLPELLGRVKSLESELKRLKESD